MASIIELADRDSGVLSSETTPESQTVAEKTARAVGQVVEAAAAKMSSAEEDNKKVAVISTQDEDEEEEDEDFDESFAERVWGLTEMFPERLRLCSSSAVSSSVNLIKSAYELSRQVVWIGVSTSVLLFAPVMFELERLNVEEMMKQDRNRLVLGPGSAVSGGAPTGPGLMPPPPTRQ